VLLIVHARYYLGDWPAPLKEVRTLQAAGFGLRSAEVIIACDRMWPLWDSDGMALNEREFFDANMTLERLTKYPPKSSQAADLRKPWKAFVPCCTGNTKMVMRYPGDHGVTLFRMLSPLDIFSLNGWGVTMFRQHESLSRTTQTPLSVGAKHPGHLKRSTFGHMAGNMWSAFHYVPVVMATFGAVDWAGCDPSLVDLGDEDEKADNDSDGDPSLQGAGAESDSDALDSE
jgi:hypothetical protein